MSQHNLKKTTTTTMLFLFAILCCLPVSPLAASDKVEVGVYFESKCPDSRNFFLNQLVPTYRAIGKETMGLVLVPFGHARVLSRDKMICQHGQRECEGNKLMACMLGQGSSDGEVVESMGCIFENRMSPRECITKHMPSTPFDTVDMCSKNATRTYELMLEAEKMTGRVSYIPHLTINGEHSEDIQNQAEWHLQDYVCKLYKGSQPPEACKQQAHSSQHHGASHHRRWGRK